MRVVPMRSRLVLLGFTDTDPIIAELSTVIDEAGIDIEVTASSAGLSEADPPQSGEYYLCRYRRLIDFLGEADHDGEAAFPDLLDQWLDECRQVLDFCQKARRQVALVDQGLLERAPQNLLVKALERLGIDEDKISEIDILEIEPAALATDPILSILVDAATRTSPSIRQVAELIEAHSLSGEGVSNSRRNVHLEEAFAAYRKYIEEPAAVRGDEEQMRTTLAGVQAELYLYREQESLLRSELESLTASLRKALAEGDLRSDEIAELTSKLDELREENRMLGETAEQQRDEIGALHASMQEALDAAERFKSENEATGRENMILRADKAKLFEEQSRLRDHISQLAAEISAATGVLDATAPGLGQGANRDLVEEATGNLANRLEAYLEALQVKLVRIQADRNSTAETNRRLQQVEADLSAQVSEINRKLDATESKLDAAESRLSSTEKEREDLIKKRVSVEKEAEQLRQDLHATRNSTSWKVTKPIRVLSNRIGSKSRP